MPDLSVQYAGLKMKNPIIVGSSGLTDSAVKNKKWEKAGCGAIVLRSLFEEQIESLSRGLLKEADYPDAYHLIRNYVKGNKVMDYLSLIRESKDVCTIPIIASINCYTDGHWIEFASQIENAGADAIELNISAVASDPNAHPMATAERYIEIVKKVKDTVGIPVIVKSSKLFNNIPWLVKQLKNCGVDAVVLFNKLFQPDINIESLKITSASVFTTPGELSDTLRWLGLTSLNVPGINLAASNGVTSWQDVIKCLLVGANAVQMVSALYKDKEGKFIPETIRHIEKWMYFKEFKNINTLRGKLNEDPNVDSTLFERYQFMKYLSDY